MCTRTLLTILSFWLLPMETATGRGLSMLLYKLGSWWCLVDVAWLWGVVARVFHPWQSNTGAQPGPTPANAHESPAQYHVAVTDEFSHSFLSCLLCLCYRPPEIVHHTWENLYGSAEHYTETSIKHNYSANTVHQHNTSKKQCTVNGYWFRLSN